jgi:hypothetical protein
VDIVANMTAVLEIVMTLITGVLVDATASGFSMGGTFFEFGVQVSNSNPTQCTPQTCPGSFYTAITTAWANIGYLTHADVLRFLHTTHFGKWAVLLYIGAAITALLGVATNSPMRNYTWFFIGPALYSFLVGTTMEVQGVNWVVANKAASSEGMAEVWRNAEAGLANTRLALDGMVRINGKNGPTDQYEVAMPMVFLDELFSATSNILIEWTGIGNQVDNGGSNSNLSTPRRTLAGRQDTEAWWLLSNMKWGYLENITASTIRNPDLRDAFVTFLASECGDLFKQGIDSGSYIAATQARGATVVDTLMVDNAKHDYTTFTKGLHSVSIPTPRSLGRLFKEKVSTTSPGSFMNFSASLNKAVPTGRTHGIVCSEYLWTLIQGFRYEAGNSYYQMLRTAPNGFDEASFVATLLYGWDARRQRNEDITSDDQKAFLKHLILAYIIRNELIAAPQITTVDQRYAPAEQAKSYSEANIRAYGSKAKFIELYNAAVMMPYLQGILAYFLIVSYPIACMLVILPGHYKGFFTWVSFFAWIKLWDVGFAMVHVVERSVWAMIGNHSHLYATSEALISTAKKVGGIGANQPAAAAAGTQSMEAWNAIPVVCSLKPETVEGQCITGQPGEDQTFEQAFELFDKLLLTGANLDLDLSNGWYIYIMAALYTAVPAVTGQLVLGAKAGSASLVKDAFSGAASDGSQAAKTGAQHAAVNALQTNQRSLGQAATAKALRKGTGPDGKGMSLAMQGVEFGNQGMREGLDGTRAGLESGLVGARAGLAGRSLENFDRAQKMGQKVPGLKHVFGADGGSGGGGAASNLGAFGAYGVEATKVGMGRMADEGFVRAAGRQQALGYQKEGLAAVSGGLKDMSGKIGAQAEFEAASAAWEAKNDFAAHASAMGGIAGMNAGNLAPNEKPTDATQMGMAGMLDRYNSGGSAAPGKASASADAANSYSGGLLYGGTSYVAAGRQLAADGKGAEQSMLDKWNNMGGSYNPVTAAARVVTEGVNTANMGTSDIADTGKKLTAFGADYAKDGKLDGDHGFRVQQVDPQGYMHSSDYSAGPSSRETSPWKFNGETNKTSTKHQD